MRAYIFRLHRNSSSLVWFRTMKEHVLFRLRKAGIDQSVLSLIDRTSMFTYPVEHAFLERKQSVRKGKCLWVKLPFHPVWCSAVSSELHKLSNLSHVAEILTSLDPELNAIKPAWCLNMPVLSDIVRKF